MIQRHKTKSLAPSEIRQLYEQIIEGKDELLRSKDRQLELLEERTTELLAEIKRLRGE